MGDLATQGVQFVHGEKGKSMVFTQYHGQFCGIKEMIMMSAVVIFMLFPIDSKNSMKDKTTYSRLGMIINLKVLEEPFHPILGQFLRVKAPSVSAGSG